MSDASTSQSFLFAGPDSGSEPLSIAQIPYLHLQKSNSIMENKPLRELLIPIVCFCLILLYHVALGWITYCRPHLTVLGLTRAARRQWVRAVVERNEGTLAVQTLRNWLMTASLLATASVTLTVGLAAFASDLRQSAASGSQSLTFYQWKLVILIVSYMCAFFAFTQTMRYFTHVGFLVSTCGYLTMKRAERQRPQQPTPPANPDNDGSRGVTSAQLERGIDVYDPFLDDEILDVPTIAALLNRGAMFHTMGLRGFYITFPLMLWLFSSWLFLGGTILLVFLLFYLDMNAGQWGPQKRV
ncbi:hypothetical protein DFS34DRAFT_629646 [Phlyctochytrium arcticum]|nr:hypothetical protein DFS34DRAFT_629646 [Phlyctochytrium arcticum]